MPLYELVMICRPGKAQTIQRTAEQLRAAAERFGAVVRNCNILGDRILSRALRAKNRQLCPVGRYVQFMVDVSPEVLPALHRASRDFEHVLQTRSFRARDFYEEAQQLLSVDETMQLDEQRILFESEQRQDLDGVIALLRRQRQGGARA